MTLELDALPFVESPSRYATGSRAIRLVVIHDAETPETATAAEGVANYFARPSVEASAHVIVDADSAVRSVADGDVAWHAPGANSDGLGIEQAGMARQSRAEWLDPYSWATVDNCANVVAQWCLRHKIPPKLLTDEELAAGERGIVSHWQVSRVYRRSDHYDPGDGYPWDHFVNRMWAWLRNYQGEAPAPPPPPPPPGDRVLYLDDPPMTGPDVAAWQTDLGRAGFPTDVDGLFGPDTAAQTVAFQRSANVAADGVVGPETRRAMADRLKPAPPPPPPPVPAPAPPPVPAPPPAPGPRRLVVACVYRGSVDEEIARRFGTAANVAVVPEGHPDVVECAIVVGAAVRTVEWTRYREALGLIGATRGETGALVDALVRRYRAAGSPQLRSLTF